MGKLAIANTKPCVQAQIRGVLQAAPTLSRTLQSGRAILHFGPWCHVARAVIRMVRPPQEQAAIQSSLLQFNGAQLVKTLLADGIAMAGTLPTETLSRVRAVTDELPPGEYGDFHDVPCIRALVQCPATLGVARGYLRAEPELLECNVVVAHAETPNIPCPKGSQRQFHFDYAGWHSLNLFIYLTDVSEDSGAHQVIIGTHRRRNLWDAIRVAIPDHEIQDRFPDRIRTITGPAGTMFFEDTAGFHRRQIHTKRRVLLNVLYASHRSWLSKGRLTVKYLDYLHSHEANNSTD